MIVEVGKAYKLQDGRDCFCYIRDKIKDKDVFYIVEQPPNAPRYNTFTVDEQGFVRNDIDKAVIGEQILPFTADSLETL